MTAPADPPAERIATLDAVRGFAVLGILLMNIVSMGLPAYAYVDPSYWGLEGAADLTAWRLNYILADGKMRALFTMLFGASMLLIAERAESQVASGGMGPAETHYRRIFWLFVFGMIHAWLFWYGDILVHYAIAGALIFPIWRWRVPGLVAVVVAMAALQLALNLGHHASLDALRDAARAPGASVEAVAAWQEALRQEVPGRADAEAEIRGYRGGFGDALAARVPMTTLFQTVFIPLGLPELFLFIALGMILFRTGFLTGRWSSRAYAAVIAAGYLIAVPLMIPIAAWNAAADWDPVLLPLTDSLSLVLRPFIALAHAALVILWLRSGRAAWLARRLAAAGRMAFSNYLGTTLVTTTLFYGYGFGLFAVLSRAELYVVVLGVWLVILLWSEPWLRRHRYGPLEWVWRSLARGELVPNAKPAIARQSQAR